MPIGLTIEGANRHDMKLLRPTIESIIIDRPEPTEEPPQGMCLDKGYDYDEVRDTLREFGFTAHIRPRGEEAKAIKREAGGLRATLDGGTQSFVDESFSPPARSLGQKAENYLAFLHFSCGLIAFRAAALFR